MAFFCSGWGGASASSPLLVSLPALGIDVFSVSAAAGTRRFTARVGTGTVTGTDSVAGSSCAFCFFRTSKGADDDTDDDDDVAEAAEEEPPKPMVVVADEDDAGAPNPIVVVPAAEGMSAASSVVPSSISRTSIMRLRRSS